MAKHPTMDGNYNYHKPKHRHSRIKNTNGSMSYSSSEEEEFNSDDNLRPYEEVKVAHNHKKLNGLGKFCFMISRTCLFSVVGRWPFSVKYFDINAEKILSFDIPNRTNSIVMVIF